MQLTGLLHGAPLLRHVDFPVAEVLGPGASEDEIKDLIDRHGQIFIKPLFKGAVGKKGKAGLIGRATDLKTALAEKERLYFVEHRHGDATAKANGVTFEGGVPAEHEVYFAITDDGVSRADDDADASRRRRDRGRRPARDRRSSLRRADRAEGLRRRQRAVRHRRAARDRLAAGAVPAQAVGTGAPLRHDDARTQSDPHAAGRQRAG